MYKKYYWTEDEIVALSNAKTSIEFIEVGLTILKRMRLKAKPIIFICGALSTGGLGTLKGNLQYFEYAANFASRQGHVVFNKLPFQKAITSIEGDTDRPSARCMKILEEFEQALFESKLIDELFLLPDWDSSREASWEYELATKLGIKISEYPTEWLIAC